MESTCPLPPQLQGKVKLSTVSLAHCDHTCDSSVGCLAESLLDQQDRLIESREAEKRVQNGGEIPEPQGVAAGTRDLSGRKGEWAPWGHGLTAAKPPITEEGKGETEIRSPCECEALVQFQTNTVAILQSLTEKNILWDDAWGQNSCESTHGGGREGGRDR